MERNCDLMFVLRSNNLGDSVGVPDFSTDNLRYVLRPLILPKHTCTLFWNVLCSPRFYAPTLLHLMLSILILPPLTLHLERLTEA